ncbi:MAG: hypothetical protein WC600_17270 [Desulfobaccales bacterium]
MIPLLGLLPIVGNLATNIMDRFFPKEMAEEEKAVKQMQLQGILYQQMMEPLAKEVEDLADARANERQALSSAGPWMNGLRAGVTVFGGYLAIGIFSWNLISPYFGFNRVILGTGDELLLGGIIAFYFGKRLTEKMSGVSAVE